MLETADGSTTITLHTDQGGHTWHIVVRARGSMCLYSTTTTDHLHHILYDTLDKTPPVPAAVAMLDRLGEIARILLALVERQGTGAGPG